MYTIASDEAVVSPRKFLPDYPVGLEAVLLKALAKDAKNRYATASELQRALDQCLPAAERANTDEDIGTFMGKLFGNKREESRAALAEALALADKQGPRPLESPLDPLTQAHNGSLSDTGLSVAGATTAESTYTSVGVPALDATQRRKRVLLISVGAAVLVAAGAAFALKGSASPAEHTPPTSSAPVASAALPAPVVAPSTPSAPAVDLATLPVESAAPAVPPPNVPRPSTAQKPQPPPPAVPVAASATSKPPKPPAPKWRQDPGF